MSSFSESWSTRRAWWTCRRWGGIFAPPLHPPMTQPTTSVQSAEEPKKPEKASLLDDFMDIFYSPSAVFARRANSGFWIPMLIVTVLLGAVFMANRDLIDPIMEAEFARSIAKSAQTRNLTPDQLAAGRKIAGTF